MAYYRSQDYERKLITSTNALVSRNDRIWSVISRGALKAALPDSPLGVTITEILSKEGGIESRFTVWQWYWINGRLTTSDIEAKWLTALSRISGRGDDSAVVMLYAPAGRSPERLSAFAAAAGPQIQQLLAADRALRRPPARHRAALGLDRAHGRAAPDPRAVGLDHQRLGPRLQPRHVLRAPTS